MLSFPGRGDLSGSNGAGVDRGPLAPAPGKDEWNDISAPNNPDLFRSMVEDTRGGIPPTDPLPRSKREEIRSIQDAATPVGRVRDVGLDGDPDATGAQAYSADSDVPLKDDLTDVDPVDGPRSMPISDPASFGAPILSDLPSPTGGSEVSLIETVDDRALSPEPQDSFSGRGPELRPRAATVFGAPAPAQLGQSKSGAAGVDSGAPVRFESYDDTLSGQGADVPRAPPRDQIGRSHDHGIAVAVRSH